MMNAAKLVEAIEKGEGKSWTLANNDGNLGELKKAIEKAKAEHGEFDKDFTLLELKVFRDRYTDATLCDGLCLFSNKLEYQKVAKITKTILGRHAMD